MTTKSGVRQQLTIEKQFYCIKLMFLQQKNFKATYENAMKLNKSYEIYLQIIENYFRAFHQYCSHIKQPSQDKIKFLYHFNCYIYDYSNITLRITDYQIECLESIKEDMVEENLSMALHQVVESVKKYTPYQGQIRLKKEALTQEFTSIKGQYMNLLKKMKKPKYYYDRKSMRGQLQQLKSKISTSEKAQQTILSQISTVDTNTTSYFQQINYFRKQLLKNKYRYHKRFTELAMNSRESLAELFYYQHNCLNDYYKLIMATMKEEDDRFGMVRAGNRTYRELVNDSNACMSGIMRNTEEFLNLLQGIEDDLKQTEKNFANISKKLNENKQRSISKATFQHINNFFQVDQSPIQMVLETINVFQYCFKKVAQKQVDLRRAAEQIQNIRKDIIKHRGITLSLLKVKLQNNKLQNMKDIEQEQIRDECGVYEFMNSLDLKPVKYLIKQCLDSLLFTFTEILQFFGRHSGSKQKINLTNSMQLSYVERPQSQIRKKRPAKHELWLWQDYRKRVDTEFTLSKQLFFQINNHYNNYKDNGQIDLELEKYECYNEQLLEQGEICLSKKMIKFISKSEKELAIPLADIQEIKRKKIVIIDYLIVKTKMGELTFRGFQNISQVEATLKEIVQTGGAPKSKIQKRPKIELTQAQKAKIQSPSRKEQIEKIRPVLSPEFQQIYVKTFQNMPIDEFYDLILSDKKFTLTGKEHDSFLVYAMKKLRNKDFKITKFQPPGPKYYTLDQNTTFQNGPLVSECKYQYNHLLDMPFLPSQCGNNESRKVFWVSDKELDYMIHAQTSGVPMSDNFYVEIVYKIKQENESTVLKVYAQIKFLKSFALKSTVESSTWKEIKEGSRDTVIEMQKGINLYKTLLSGKAVEQQQQPEQGEVDSKKEMQKLKQRNMYLIIAVVAIILINILVKIFF